MGQDIKHAWALMKFNFKALIQFEILYKLLMVFIFSPGAYGLLRISTYLNNKGYVASNSLSGYLLNPFVLLCFALIAILTAIAVLLEMNALIICFHAAYKKEKITAVSMLKKSLDNVIRHLEIKNWPIIIFVVFIVPITNMALTSSYISKLQLPEFIDDYISSSVMLDVLLHTVLALLTFLMVRWVFSVHAYTLKESSFVVSIKDSGRLIQKRYWHTFFVILFWQLLNTILFVVFGLIIGGISFYLINEFVDPDLQHFVAKIVLYVVGYLFMAISAVLTGPVSFAILSSLYYRYSKEKEFEAEQESASYGKYTIWQRLLAGVLCIALICSIGFSAVLTFRESSLSEDTKLEIQAHRGDSISAPENTMPAFENAIMIGADWIELDVHQTKDGVIVVTHDESIKRIAGVNKKVWELTYDELEQYDTGSWFAPQYSDVRVATLDEVLKLCKGKIKLNIELKPTGHEPDFEQHVIDIVKANDFQEECALASLNANTLMRIKELDPSMSTIYITTVAIGNVSKLAFADAFSVEESFVNGYLVNKIHRSGKKIYAWTVNKSENGIKMQDYGVDSIITDDPAGMRQTVNNTSPLPEYEWIVDYLFPIEDNAI